MLMIKYMLCMILSKTLLFVAKSHKSKNSWHHLNDWFALFHIWQPSAASNQWLNQRLSMQFAQPLGSHVCSHLAGSNLSPITLQRWLTAHILRELVRVCK